MSHRDEIGEALLAGCIEMGVTILAGSIAVPVIALIGRALNLF